MYRAILCNTGYTKMHTEGLEIGKKKVRRCVPSAVGGAPPAVRGALRLRFEEALRGWRQWNSELRMRNAEN